MDKTTAPQRRSKEDEEMDEYLEGIANREPKAESAPVSSWEASINGFTIHTNPRLANGWIELRDKDDKIIGHIDGVKAIHIARY